MNDKLFESLRNYRLRIAREKGIPPFLIYNDATIRELIEKKPNTFEELGKIKNFPKGKIVKYGSSILRLINESDNT